MNTLFFPESFLGYTLERTSTLKVVQRMPGVSDMSGIFERPEAPVWVYASAIFHGEIAAPVSMGNHL
jgi:hypothetical protein